MISDNERREIAAELRESWKQTWHGEKMMHRLREALEIDRSASEYGKFRYYRTVAERLADLIDPRTCTVDEWRWTDDDDPMPHMCVTSLSCGHEAVTLYGAPRYCPECGAGVVDA